MAAVTLPPTASRRTTALLGERYLLGELLGRGGMADVHRAFDLVQERLVAVKVLRNPVDKNHRSRFISEAQILARFNHPNIVTLLDAGLAGDLPYLVMDLVDGPTLATACIDRSIEAEQVTRLGIELANALACAHASGVVHRDVKPSNVLVAAADGHCCLTDFGIARLIGDLDHHTSADETIGSPAYLAPEQVNGEPVTPAIDIYSLGLVLLETLTGRRAYTGTPVEAAIARLRVAPAIPVRLGTRWCALLEHMTRLDPAQRPTADEVASILDGCGQGCT